MDPRGIILVLIVAAIIFYYYDIKVVLWLALLGIFIAFFALAFTIFRGEGKLAIIINWWRRTCKKYKKIEAKFFKWIDSI